MSRTQDNFASGLGGNIRSNKAPQANQGPPVFKKQFMRPEGEVDPELERIYGTARGGIVDMTQMSDWEKDSQRSGKSIRSQFTQLNSLKVKGLESIYLQRLEPASKGRKTGLKKAGPGEDKAKFRQMHHKYHDEPEWYADDANRDELDSIISGNYKEMQKKFEEEFQGKGGGGGSSNNRRLQRGKNGSSLLSGNLKGYKDNKYRPAMGAPTFDMP